MVLKHHRSGRRIRRLIGLIILVAIGVHAQAQLIGVDSLRTRLRTEGKTTARFDLLLSLGYELYNQDRDSGCLAPLQEAQALAKELKYASGQAYDALPEAFGLHLAKRYRASIAKFQECISSLDAQGIQQTSVCPLTFIREPYNAAGLQEERLAYFKAAIARYELNGPEP